MAVPVGFMVKTLAKAFNEASKNEAFRTKMEEIGSKLPADKGVDEYASHLDNEPRDTVDKFLPPVAVDIKHSVTDKVNDHRAAKEPKVDKMTASLANGGRFVAELGGEEGIPEPVRPQTPRIHSIAEASSGVTRGFEDKVEAYIPDSARIAKEKGEAAANRAKMAEDKLRDVVSVDDLESAMTNQSSFEA